MSEVWMRERPSPRRRAPSVEQIVARAVAIADAEGVAAATMRRVASELRSGTASLYRYVTNRDELLDLMIDAVRGESSPPTPTGSWRVDLAAIAHQLRDTALRHPWLATEVTGRPPLGPNSLRHTDVALEVALSLTPDASRASSVIEAVRAYVFGSVAAELAELQVQTAYRRDRGAVAGERGAVPQPGDRVGHVPVAGARDPGGERGRAGATIRVRTAVCARWNRLTRCLK